MSINVPTLSGAEPTATNSHEALRRSFGKKVADGLFNPVRRVLHGRADAEDRLQEGIAQTWVRSIRHVRATGEILPDLVLVAICRRRAVSSRDFLVPRPRRKYSLDLYDALSRRGETAMIIPEDTVPLSAPATPIEEAIDLLAFVASLESRTHSVVAGLIEGASYREIAVATATSSPTVSRIVAALRTQLANYCHG